MEIKIPTLLRIKPNALFKIGKYIKQEGFTSVAVYWGEGIQELFRETVEISFSTAQVHISHEEVVATNEIDDAFASSKKLPHDVEAVIAIGGGTVVDFSKFVGFVKQLPQFAVPTVISNDAFAAPGSSLTVDGKRKTVKTAVPHAVILDTKIISQSPRAFLYSGIGDLLCKTTAVEDWKMAYRKRGEPVNDFAATISQRAVDTFSYYHTKEFENMEYIGVIASSLLMTGIAMIVAGSSRPASGGEHLISHAYDEIADNPSLHGLQVGVASYAISHLQGSTFDRVKTDILNSRFYEFMKEHPLSRDDFKKAIMMSRQMKEKYYTVLSDSGNLSRLEAFVDSDELMQDMLV